MKDLPQTDWLATPLGHAVFELERRLMRDVLGDVFGFELLQVGHWGDASLVGESARTQHRCWIAPGSHGPRAIRADYDALPVATGSVEPPIFALPGVIGTHHIGASTDQAQEAIAAETVRIIKTYFETGRVVNVVNLSRDTRASHVLVVRHKDKPGVLAGIFDVLREAKVNVEETENIVFTGAEACVARINLDAEPADAILQQAMAANPNRWAAKAWTVREGRVQTAPCQGAASQAAVRSAGA